MKHFYSQFQQNNLRTSWRSLLTLMLFACLGINSLNAQVSSYIFTQNTGSFTGITGTTLGTATANTGTASLYNVSFPVTLPFSFNFNNQNYTDITASSNGYVTFGTGSATGSVPISTTTAYDGAVSAWGRSINSISNIAGKTGSMSWTVEGIAPNRVAVMQWENFKPFYSTSIVNVAVFSFQIRLAETTNVISTVYSSSTYLAGSTAIASTNAQIGLRGATNADFNNRTNPATVSFINSNSGTASSNGQSFNTLNDPPGMPSDGLTYTWTPSTCKQPSAVTVNNITINSAEVSWSAPATAPANGYDVYYSTSDTSPNNTTTPTFAGVAGLSQNLTGLTPATEYFVWVRSACSGTENSNWTLITNFISACLPVNYMFEDFDSYGTGSIVPLCWERIITGTGIQTISSSSPNSGTRNLYMTSNTAANSSIVVLPLFGNINAGTHWLRLKAKVTITPRVIDFGYVTDAADANSFVLLDSKTINNTSYTSADSEYTIGVPTTVPAGARLAIRNAGIIATAAYFDDIYWEPAPSCLAPAALAVSNISQTDATIDWNASVSTPANGYDLYYSLNNTDPVNTTTPTIAGIAGTSQVLSGLSASTTYYVWIRSACSASDKSAWVPLPSFKTLCTPVGYMYENFDSYATGNLVPDCWERILGGGGTLNISSNSPNSGTRNLYLNSTVPGNSVIVVLPPFNNISSGTNWIRLKARVTTVPRTIEFGYVTDPLDANSFVLLQTRDITNTSYTALDSEYNFPVPAGTPATARLALRNPGTLSTALYIDDVYWEPAPTCLRPSDLTGSGTTPTTANLTWSASTTQPINGYEMYYSTSNTPPTSTTTPVLTGITGTSSTLSNLTPSTVYYVWVRTRCNANDVSDWSLMEVLNTTCQPPAILTTNVNPNPVCVGGTATMSATADTGATIKWYDAATGGTLLATNSSYTTPVLTATTNYYVTASTGSSSNVGKVTLESNATTGGALSTYMTFTALSDFTLSTVDLFPYSSTDGTAGTVTVELRTDTGVPIISTTVNVVGVSSVANSVAQTVALNFPIVGGKSYRLGVSNWTGITNLYRDSVNLAYPYTVPGVVDITGSSLSTTYYYFFYNWSVLSGCESARTMVTATYDPNCQLGTAESGIEKQFSVYPNPFTDVLNISDVKDVVSVAVTDLSGRTVKTIAKPSSQIHLGELQSGMYLVTLKYKNGSVKAVKAIKK